MFVDSILKKDYMLFIDGYIQVNKLIFKNILRSIQRELNISCSSRKYTHGERRY